MVDNFECPYIVILETTDYTGNFERELCAYATGSVGECEVGSRQADDFAEEYPDGLSVDTQNVADDRGCWRPCSIFDERNGYNSMVIFFEDQPSEADVGIIIERAHEYLATKRPGVQLKRIQVAHNQVVRKITPLHTVTF